MILKAIGPLAMNYFEHATQMVLRPYSVSGFNRDYQVRIDELMEVINLIAHDSVIELHWIEILKEQQEKMQAQINLEN